MSKKTDAPRSAADDPEIMPDRAKAASKEARTASKAAKAAHGAPGAADENERSGAGAEGNAGNAARNTGNSGSAGNAGNTGSAGSAATSETGPEGAPEGNNPCEGENPAPDMQKELAAERDKYLRLAAEYDNYRKRSMKERENAYGDARADTVTRLLPVYDNLERALRTDCADEAFYKGIEMIMTQLTELLEGMNVKRIPAVGEAFDPNRHDAVLSIENPELGKKIIAEECKKGFMLGDRVIRHSTVVVAN